MTAKRNRPGTASQAAPKSTATDSINDSPDRRHSTPAVDEHQGSGVARRTGVTRLLDQCALQGLRPSVNHSLVHVPAYRSEVPRQGRCSMTAAQVAAVGPAPHIAELFVGALLFSTVEEARSVLRFVVDNDVDQPAQTVLSAVRALALRRRGARPAACTRRTETHRETHPNCRCVADCRHHQWIMRDSSTQLCRRASRNPFADRQNRSATRYAKPHGLGPKQNSSLWFVRRRNGFGISVTGSWSCEVALDD